MDLPLYWAARCIVVLLQVLPLPWVARLGRAAGAVVHLLDARHRRMARGNLSLCFRDEMSPRQIRAMARENFRRIGENFACAVKTGVMSDDQLKPYLSFSPAPSKPLPERMVVAVGHFGNFELYARIQPAFPKHRLATTYRGLPSPGLDRLLGKLRAQSGCLFFERRTESRALRQFMTGPNVMLGLLADQNAGAGGFRLPFLGRDCSTTAAPAVFALRYQCALFTSICYRVAPGRWHIALGPEIPTTENGKPRALSAIMADVNQAFEAAVRRDPANWFWVHNRWKARRFRTGSAA